MGIWIRYRRVSRVPGNSSHWWDFVPHPTLRGHGGQCLASLMLQFMPRSRPAGGTYYGTAECADYDKPRDLLDIGHQPAAIGVVGNQQAEYGGHRRDDNHCEGILA
jgi:hypothetical protein